MGMVVRTNMAGLNANNALNAASKVQQNAMQKLASGFRINKAADDASGLAISEKMKNQIKALDTAADNCEDGANMIQTAEGYMGEVHDMLNRMVELSEKSANGVLDQTDRDALQDEMDQLCSEIDRVATTANFNGHKLMDGSLGNRGVIRLETDPSNGTVTYHKPSSAGISQSQYGDVVSYTTQNVLTVGGNSDLTYTAQGESGEVNVEGTGRGIDLQIGESSTKADRLSVQIDSFHTDTLLGGLAGFVNNSNDVTETSATAYVKLRNNYTSGENKAASAAFGEDGTNVAVLGYDESPSVYDGSITGKSTYASALSIDITDMDAASAAADALRQVSNFVSDQRGQMGAIQNRLDHTVNNLTTASENITASKSRITDTNMAEEMMNYTSKNVIAQAAQAMLAQANSQPQNVLSLLQ